jgi:hypothetical protein
LFFPPPQSFKPASTHREEEVVQPVFGVERNLPCTGQIPKAKTHNKQSLLSAKKFLFLDLSSLKNPYGKKTVTEEDHIEKETTTDQNTNTERQKANQISKQNTESEKDT